LTAASGGTFAGARGCAIAWRSWGSLEHPRGVIVIAHGFGEHSGRYEHVADRLVAEGFAVFALDHHGHGRSCGERARIAFADAVADLDRMVDLAAEEHPGAGMFLLGHSMGGAIALRYAAAHGDRLQGLIVSGPLAEVEGRTAVKLVGRVLGRLAPRMPLASLDPGLVSRDPAVVAAYQADPLVHHRPIPAGTVAEFLRHADSLPQELARVRVPVLIVWGTADGLCAPSGSAMVSEQIGSSDVTTIPYEGLYHEVLNEPERERVLADIVGWLQARVPARSAEERSAR
jgi:alpha-beta hydrolase superfamily lysophospholipase